MEETKHIMCNNTFCTHNSEKQCLNDFILLDTRGICTFCEMETPPPTKKYPRPTKNKTPLIVKQKDEEF
ncbi:MAG: hypothetical protein IKU80_01765 [Firmicutes bacterium]|nr:hypothetical protein [Bacillota bacterium]